MEDLNYLDIAEGFGQRLRYFLREEGITESAFAKSIGRKAGISNYEKQPGTLPKASFLLGIAQKYPTWSLEYIVFGKGEPYRTTEPNSQTPKNLGYWANVARWIDFRQEVDQDLKKLPLEGYKPLYDRLTKAVKVLHEENLAMLNYLEGMSKP